MLLVIDHPMPTPARVGYDQPNVGFTCNPQLSKNLLKRSLKNQAPDSDEAGWTYIDSRLDISSLVDLDFENLIKTQHCPIPWEFQKWYLSLLSLER